MKQGEIWRVSLDPTVGAEMKKSRPCLILNGNTIGKLPLKLIAPLTDYKEIYLGAAWMVTIDPSPLNGLTKRSTIDLFQVRSVSQKRLIEKIGVVDDTVLKACRDAIEVVIK